MKNSLEEKTNPCDNFYKFACEQWILTTRKPPSEILWNRWHETAQTVKNRLQRILEKPRGPPSQMSSPLLKAHRAYKSCLEQDLFEDVYLKQLKTLVNSLGKWPLATANWKKDDHDWTLLLALVTRLIGVHPMIKVNVGIDLQNTTKYVIYIDGGDFIMPKAILLNRSKYPKEMRNYEKWIYNTAKVLTGEGLARDVKAQIRDLVQFEVDLAFLTEIDRKVLRSDAEGLSEMFRMNWLNILKEVFFQSGVQVYSNDTVVVLHEEYLIRLLQFVKKTDIRTLCMSYLVLSIFSFYYIEFYYL